MRKPSHFLFLFLDGVGIGEKDPAMNPFFSSSLLNFNKIFGGVPSRERPTLETSVSHVQPCDALLGVEGLPQSGTGQVSLFTGVNVAQVIGMHFGPYPHSQTRAILEQKNIFRVLNDLGASVHFANAFPRQFFEYIDSGKRRLSATTMSCLLSGIPICNENSLIVGDAISADITGERWITELGYSEVRPLRPFDSGRRLRNIAEKYDFTMFEFFLTDKAGHEQDKAMAESVLETFDEFLGGITEGGTDNITILLSSDHGNIEDLSVKTHTLNPSFTGVTGEYAEFFLGKFKSITDVTPAIVTLFKSRLI